MIENKIKVYRVTSALGNSAHSDLLTVTEYHKMLDELKNCDTEISITIISVTFPVYDGKEDESCKEYVTTFYEGVDY